MGDSTTRAFKTAIWAKQAKALALVFGGVMACGLVGDPSTLGKLISLGAATAFVAWGWLRAPKMGAYADAESLRVVGIVRTRTLSWSEIDHFALVGGTCRAFRRHGLPVMIAGVGAWSRWSRRRSEANEQVEALNELLSQRRFPAPPAQAVS